MKAERQIEPAQTVESWWVGLDREAFTVRAAEELPRLYRSTLGKGRGRSISTEEIER